MDSYIRQLVEVADRVPITRRLRLRNLPNNYHQVDVGKLDMITRAPALRVRHFEVAGNRATEPVIFWPQLIFYSGESTPEIQLELLRRMPSLEHASFNLRHVLRVSFTSRVVTFSPVFKGKLVYFRCLDSTSVTNTLADECPRLRTCRSLDTTLFLHSYQSHAGIMGHKSQGHQLHSDFWCHTCIYLTVFRRLEKGDNRQVRCPIDLQSSRSRALSPSKATEIRFLVSSHRPQTGGFIFWHDQVTMESWSFYPSGSHPVCLLAFISGEYTDLSPWKCELPEGRRTRYIHR